VAVVVALTRVYECSRTNPANSPFSGTNNRTDVQPRGERPLPYARRARRIEGTGRERASSAVTPLSVREGDRTGALPCDWSGLFLSGERRQARLIVTTGTTHRYTGTAGDSERAGLYSSDEVLVYSPITTFDHAMSRLTFYFDLGSPFAYLAAERLHEVVGESVAWQPVSLGALFKLTGRSSWSLGDTERRQAGMAEVERRGRLYGLPPVRWPDPWPGDYLMAMRAATFAYRERRGHEFAMQAFRNAFQEGSDLSIAAEVLRAAEDAGLDPCAVEAATQDPDIKLALRNATDAAHELGVFGVPTIAVDGELFWGDDRLEEAAAHLRASRTG
jgi:2-hydroxychromene-2-carboxylate isomerase